MAVMIRMRRMGNNKKPFFRVVATDSRCSNSGRFLEVLGWYDPKQKGTNYELKMDRVDLWQKQGAQISDTVASLVRRARATGRGVAGAAPAAPAATA
jgi:small subunit ribosomal protein S16